MPCQAEDHHDLQLDCIVACRLLLHLTQLLTAMAIQLASMWGALTTSGQALIRLQVCNLPEGSCDWQQHPSVDS